MEQKRTLWIIAAVGVFLLVVLGAAVILYSPTSRGQQNVANSSSSYSDKTTSSNGWISLAPSSAQIEEENLPYSDSKNQAEQNYSESVPSNENEKRVEDMTIYANNATIYSSTTENAENQSPSTTNIYNTTTIDLTPLAQAKEAESSAITGNVNKVEKIVEKNSGKKSAITKKNVSVSKTENVAKETSQKSQKSVSKNVKQNEKTQTKVATKEQKTVYWIQVTALTSRKSADEARETLEKNQISADVFTYKDSKNRLFYRVRVGPYTTQSEAEYWRSKISAIEPFKNNSAYVTSTSVEKI